MRGTFGLLLLVWSLFPSLSHAQVPFGGFDRSPLPFCTCTPTPVIIPCGGTPTPPKFTFDLFAPLYIGNSAPAGGFLAIPIGIPLMFPQYALFPGEVALGFMTLGAVPCGTYIPIPGLCTPPYLIMSGLCIPIPIAVGTVTPFTGAVPSVGLGF